LRIAAEAGFDGKKFLGPVLVVTQGRDIVEVRTGDQETGEQPPTGSADIHVPFLLPGFVDAHVHVTLPGDGSSYEQMAELSDLAMGVTAVKNLIAHLRCGVTTARDNGGRDLLTVEVRDLVEQGFVVGPRLRVCGSPVTPTGGHFWWCGGAAHGVVEVTRVVRRLVSGGVDHIKIMASGGGTAGSSAYAESFDPAELHAIVRQSHALGRRVTAHCRSAGSIVAALDAGCDAIEHVEFLDLPSGGFPPPGIDIPRRSTYDSGLIERAIEAGTYLSLTIAAGGYEELRGLVPPTRGGTRLEDSERLSKLFEHKQLLMRRMLEDGAHERLLLSSDAGPPRTPFGHYASNLELAVAGGMDLATSLRCATSQPAAAIGLAEDVGSLAPGMRADLLALDDDPRRSLDALRAVRAVWKEGQRVSLAPAHEPAAEPTNEV
jgi:imidazolonepropionase-like amidohydrolase